MIVYSPFFKKEFNINKAEHIGQGNFAQVYRVYDSDINDSLAIRKVTKNMAEGQDIEKQKVINEQLKRVENENILKIYDIIESEDSIWYITQYCEGGSLWDALNDCLDNKMNEKDALQCIYQISKGVQQLHNHRITHRDLKPENILLKTRYIPGKPIPVIKIADFGLSTKKIIMETIAGTKQYIAPQQARFHNYTNAVDVWSLGIIFDEILHGTPFYVGDNNKQVFQKILKTPYKVRDQKLRESIKEFLVMILKKKSYERPIIAVICQNIQKILDEIQNQSGSPAKNQEKKELRKVKIYQESRYNRQQSDQMPLTSMRAQRYAKGSRFQRKPTGLNYEENKPKTPYKKTAKMTEQNEQKQQRQGRGMKYEQSNSRSKGKQKNLQNETDSKRNNYNQLSNEKINLYKVQKKKNQFSSHKQNQKFEQNVIQIGQYISEAAKMKEDIKSNQLLKIVPNQIQFIPSAHINPNDMPEKTNLDKYMNDFREAYDYLNTVSYDDEYESKLHKGKNQLKVNKIKCEKGIGQYKQKIRQAFLDQINKYIDSYVFKAIE